MSEFRGQRREPARVRLPLWAVGTIGTALLLLLAVAGYFVFVWAFNFASGIEVTSPDLSGVESVNSAETNPTNNDEPQRDLADPSVIRETTNEPESLLPLDTFQAWEGTERVNVLMLGVDVRCEESGPTHTDSMILVSVDPVSQSVSMLSIPRDIWVEIPGVGMDSINQAHFWGEVYEYPGGPPQLAMDTVENFLGVRVDHYITISFEGFRDFINLIDSIEVDVPVAIDDPYYPDECYGYEPFQIDAGLQPMNGPIALKYARTRATGNGDIDRAGRQQAVMLAVRDKVTSVNMLPQLIARSPLLWNTFQDNIKTSFTDSEVIQLALLANEIPRENITNTVIDYSYLYNETAPNGRQVLVPNHDAIRDLREELFAHVVAPTPKIENLEELVAEEGATVLILNGTQVFGLAGATEAYLVENGVDVIEIGNADSAAHTTTQIYDYGDHPNTLIHLTQLMDIPPLNASQSNLRRDYDILIILGADWPGPEGWDS